MIRLNLPREPYWLDLPHGVRVLVRPIDTAIDAASRAGALEALRSQPRDPSASPARRLGESKAALAVALAQVTILDWSGVLPAEGQEPAPVTAGTIAQLMAIPVMAERFLKLSYAPLERLTAEGEGCGAAPAGLPTGPSSADVKEGAVF